MSPLLERARETLKIEIAGLEGLIERLGPEFEEAVNLLYACQGKVILAGMGKSGLIARKIAATSPVPERHRCFYMPEKVLMVIWESLPGRMLLSFFLTAVKPVRLCR
tara:strand:+ start:378 stop:698 length:321 start_codon:yes stop_codon:yes gene_type:complete